MKDIFCYGLDYCIMIQARATPESPASLAEQRDDPPWPLHST